VTANIPPKPRHTAASPRVLLMPTAPERSADDEGTGLLEALWRYKLLAVVIVVGMVALALVASYPGAGRNTASVAVALDDPRGSLAMQGSGVSASDLPRYTQRRSDFATTDAVLARAATLAHTNLAHLRKHISVSPDLSTDAFHIVASAGSAGRATLYATSVAKAYRDLTKQALDAQYADAKKALATQEAALEAVIAAHPVGNNATAAAAALTQLNVRSAEISETAATFGDGIDYIDRARVKSTGKSTAVRNGAIGLIFGLLISALVAWFLAARRPWVEHGDQVAQLIDEPFLGEVSAARSVRQLGAALSASRDGYEIVSTTVGSLVTGGILLVVSPTPSLGRTETALHAAIAAVNDGRRVLIIDADNKRRDLSQALGLADSAGLVDVLKGTAWPNEVAQQLNFDGVPLDCLGAGPSIDDTASLYQSQRAFQFLANARETYELVIIDCAPLLGSAAASALARGADRVLLVVDGGTSVGIVKRARQQLSLLGLPLVGFVFSQRRSTPTASRAASR
jgi:polysaccharide biosynthesis transport protein